MRERVRERESEGEREREGVCEGERERSKKGCLGNLFLSLVCFNHKN